MTEEQKSNVTSTTKFDERRKILIHHSVEERDTEIGHLRIEVTDTRKEEGIRKTINDLNSRRKVIIENIQRLEEATGEVPEMTPRLEELQEELKKLQLIRHHENSNDESRKKEQDQLDKNREDLKAVDKSLKEIKEAIGTRLNI